MTECYYFTIELAIIYDAATDGLRLMSRWLLSASSLRDTRPLCFTNLAIASNSSWDM